MIVVKQLTKIFQKPSHPASPKNRGSQAKGDILAVNGVNLNIKRGTVFGLIGPNGAGKTTLIKLLSTLIKPTTGSAKINGFDIADKQREIRASIGLCVGGDRSFYWRLTGKQNLDFFGALQGLRGNRLHKKVEELLELFDLAREDKPLRYYSTGMRRKLDMARSFLTDPPILFLDEPTSSIDPSAAIKIRDVISSLSEAGKTILLVTHNLHEAEKLCDRIAIMQSGKFIAKGSVDVLKALSKKRKVTVQMEHKKAANVVATMLSGINSVENTDKRDSELTILVKDQDIASVLQMIFASNFKILSLNTSQPTLEDAFLEIVGNRKLT